LPENATKQAKKTFFTTFFLHLSMGGKQKKTKFVADNVKVTLKT
jgi:hypothetical protein